MLGLDPDPARLWPRALEAGVGAAEPAGAPVAATAEPRAAGAAVAAAEAVSRHCALAIAAAGPYCVAVKLQVACFERLGPPGWAVLREVAAYTRKAGLLVIADAKRGDIDVSAAAYAQAFLGATPTPYGRVDGVGADAITVNPLLGFDALGPFLTAARSSGAGLFVLVRTSNPGAADVQDLPLAGGGAVADRLAAMVAELAATDGAGGRLSDVGAVVGATAAEQLARLRKLMPRSVLLVPGVGAQGGRVEDLAPAFNPGRAGGLVTVSRGIVDAGERTGDDPAHAAAEEARRLRDLIWALADSGGASQLIDAGAGAG